MASPEDKKLTKGELWWFLSRIEELCVTVLLAWEDLVKLKEQALQPGLTESQKKQYSYRMWARISVIFTDTANISKIIYGGGQLKFRRFGQELDNWYSGKTEEQKRKLYNKLYNEKGKSRINALKNIFSQVISESGIDYEKRSVRDLLEHFDTSLQLYLIEEGPEDVINRSYGGFTEEQLRERNELKKCLSYFSCSQNKVFLLGKGIPTEPIINLIEKLKVCAELERKKLEQEEK